MLLSFAKQGHTPEVLYTCNMNKVQVFPLCFFNWFLCQIKNKTNKCWGGGHEKNHFGWKNKLPSSFALVSFVFQQQKTWTSENPIDFIKFFRVNFHRKRNFLFLNKRNKKDNLMRGFIISLIKRAQFLPSHFSIWFFFSWSRPGQSYRAAALCTDEWRIV